MFVKNITFFVVYCQCLLLLFVPCDSLNNRKRTCDLENACRCSFPSGIAIDLSELGLRHEWLEVAVEPNVTLYFHPCSDLPIGPFYEEGNDCYCGASVCLYKASAPGGSYTNLGRANEASFLNEGGLFNPIYLRYRHNNWTTTFRILCDTESNDISNTRVALSVGDIEQNHLKLELTSVAACLTYKPLPLPSMENAGTAEDGGLSTGSVLCILFFVFLGVYFLGGALALRCLRGATGREMVPNVDFWAALPELIKDGVTFALNGCKVRPSLYDSI